MTNTYVPILLVEDDDVDAENVVRAFKRLKVQNPVIRAVDGIEALTTLRGSKGTQPLPEPHLILLDLNLPRMGGIEFLQTIRQDESFKNSIVIVLTASHRVEDEIATAAYQVAGYIAKLVDGFGFAEVIKLLNQLQDSLITSS